MIGSKANKILLIATIVTAISAYNIPHAYYVGIAVTFLLMAIIIRLNVDLVKIGNTIVVLTLSNLLDELFFTPQKLGINEILISVMLLLYLTPYDKFRDSNIYNKINIFFTNNRTTKGSDIKT